MFVGERMSHPVITIHPEMPIVDALNLMKRQHIRRAPVVKDGELVGIVSDKDLLNASPSPAESISVWEMSNLLSKIQIKDVMTTRILTVTEDTPIEVAARLMVDNKIGGLPVMRGREIVGMITETDLFKMFLELMGARDTGVRVTALIQEERGQLARITQAITEAGGNFISFGQFSGDSPSNRVITFKVNLLNEEVVTQAISPWVNKLIDVRICCE